jgi:hypothetical protein
MDIEYAAQNIASQKAQNIESQKAAKELARDEVLAEDCAALAREAAERATFHAIELERWQRVGRAAAEAARIATERSDVAKFSVEDFTPVSMPSTAARQY